MGKLSTPDWIREGFDSKADWEKAHHAGTDNKSKKGKMFKVRKCPKCGSTNVSVVLVGEEGKKADKWQCEKCKWVGRDIEIEEIPEEEFLKMGEEA